MDVDAIRTKVKECIQKVTGIDAATISDSAAYVEDLDLDSLSILEISVSVEESFKFHATDEELSAIRNVEDTVALGSRLGRQLRAGDVVVLSGPLGAGKTVLAKGIAAAMDVERPVTSPSYVLARVHPPRRPGAPAMIHVDMYRLLDHGGADLLGELDSLDLDTDLDDAVVVVEWGEGLAERLSERHLDIRLERISHSDTRIATWRWGA